jgi:endonuclease/exonuclease/phosphatase (EEP) superfamily protein YafD
MNVSLNPPRLQLTGLLEVASCLSVLLPLFGCLGKHFWVLDLFSHFRLQYTACLVFSAFVYYTLKRRKLALICLLAACSLFAPFLSYYIPSTKTPSQGALKLISFNVNTANKRYADVVKFILSQNADVVFLMEVDSEWQAGLRDLDATYPHSMKLARDDNFGIAVFSKHPFIAQRILSFAEADDIPAPEFSLSINGQTVHLTGIHSLPPVGRAYTEARNSMLMQVARKASERKADHVIIMGDFNLTPFSPWFAHILRASGLKDSAVGFGISPTWQRHLPFIAVPIDQVFVSQNLSVLSRRLGDRLGSDHNPLIVEIGLSR